MKNMCMFIYLFVFIYVCVGVYMYNMLRIHVFYEDPRKGSCCVFFFVFFGGGGGGGADHIYFCIYIYIKSKQHFFCAQQVQLCHK